ncbi:MAG: DNA primase [Candidatus Heimdallarchaeota archaeon]|nr:DNA primase [Candidatus Heimdallarchaeota archaeon]
MPPNNHQNFPHDIGTTKYMIHASFIIDGVVEKPDVVGALFGQTEGLLSDDLDLRELQKGGRVGRIQVYLRVKHGKTSGKITIPSSLDKVETSILAAAIETVDRIGPCDAKLKIVKIEDVREEKRQKIIERASTLLKNWDSSVSDSSEIADEVLKATRVGGITHFGSLPAGPELNDSDTIIVVEGRADIAACLRAGVRNTIAVQGAKIPKTVSDLSKKKNVIAFLDGDRGGDLILKELLMYADIDFVARAPEGREVEDLKPKEIIEQLAKKRPLEEAGFITQIYAKGLLEQAIQRKTKKQADRRKQVQRVVSQVSSKQSKPTPKSPSENQTSPQPKRSSQSSTKTKSKSTSTKSRTQQRSSSKPPSKSSKRYSSKKRSSRSKGRSGRKSRRRSRKIPEDLEEIVKSLQQKEEQEGVFLDENSKEIKRVPVASLYKEVKDIENGTNKILFDGIITQRLIDACKEKKIEILVGAKTADLKRRTRKPKIYTFA